MPQGNNKVSYRDFSQMVGYCLWDGTSDTLCAYLYTDFRPEVRLTRGSSTSSWVIAMLHLSLCFTG